MDVNQILLGLLGRALFAAEFTFDAKNAPWAGLFAESRAQTVELLAFDALTDMERSVMPPEIASAWQTVALQRLGQNEQLRYAQGQVLAALKKEQIHCAVLKGSSCAVNYPNPALRCAGDIDLLVGEKGLAPARKVLESLGYTATEEPHPVHLHMHKGAQVVELHHEPAGIPRGDEGKSLRRFFAGSETRAEPQKDLPVLSVKEQAVTLLLHKLEHIVSSGLGLRQLCDWAVFVHARLSAAQWQTLEPLLRTFGLLNFTKVITRICVDALALPRSAAPWCLEADSVLARRLLEDLLRTGNFGRKENRYGQRLFTDAASGNRLVSFLKVGARTCRDHWPLCDRYPVLLPAAPAVLLLRYRKQRREGKRPAFRPRDIYKTAGDRRALYAELKPFLR